MFERRRSETKRLLEDIEAISVSNASSSSEQYNENQQAGQIETLEKHLIDYGRPWYRVPGLLKLNFWILIISFASVGTGYDGSLINGLLSLDQWNRYFGNPTGIRLGLLASGMSFGNAFVMSRSADIICDRFGRRFALGLGQSLLVIGAILQGSSKNFKDFFIARFILGMSHIAGIAAPVLIAEIAYPSHRSIATAVYNTSWYIGAFIASSVTYLTYTRLDDTNDYNWRIPSYLQGVFALANLFLYFWTPESPRFLIKHGRVEEARDVFIKFHANGDAELGKNLVDFEVREIQTALEYEEISKNTSFSSFFKTKANIHRFFLCAVLGLMITLSGNSLVSYFLSLVLDSIGITSSKTQLQINMLLMFYNYVTSLFFAYLTGKFRRRATFLTSTIIMLISYVIWTTLSALNESTNYEHRSLAVLVLVMIFVFYSGYNLALNVLPALYASEILPYSLRTKGFAVLQFVCIISGLLSAFVNPIAMVQMGWKYYIVYCVILALEVNVVYFTFVETFGLTLEEVSSVVFKEKVPDYGKVSSSLLTTSRYQAV